MVISFVIFLGFISALFFFLNPFEKREIGHTLFDITKYQFIESWYSNYNTISLTIVEGIGQGTCFKVSNPFTDLGSGNLLVKDQAGNIRPSDSDASMIWIEPASNNRYYLLYFSEEFEAWPGGLGPCGNEIPAGDYSFGTLNTYETAFYENIQEFAGNYETDYEGLRQSLNLQNDFVFTVYDQEGELLIETTRFVPKHVEVLARDIPVSTIDKNAELNNLIVNLRVWN